MDLFHAFADDSVHRRIDLRLNEAERRTDQVDRATVALEARGEELEAINAGLWALLKATLNLNDDDLSAAMRKQAEAAQAIETPPPCPSCGRNLLALNSPNCSWCGQPIERLPFKSSDVEYSTAAGVRQGLRGFDRGKDYGFPDSYRFTVSRMRSATP